MSYERIIGIDDLTLVSTRAGYVPGTGRSLVLRYQGPQTKVTEEFSRLLSSDEHDGVFIDQDDGRHDLVITYADDTEQYNRPNSEFDGVWRVIPQDVYRNLRAHETFNKDADQVDLDEARLWFETGGFRGTDPQANEPEATYLSLLKRGTDEFLRTTVVLRYSLFVGRRSDVRVSWKGVDRAWQFRSEVAGPNPTYGLGADIVADQLSLMPDFDDGKKQWLKRGPAVEPVDRGRFHIHYDWWFARRWSESLYEGDTEDGNP